jgi:CRP-like cAMP-binding protein
VALEYAKPQERASRLRFFQGLDPSFIDAFFSFAIVRRYLAREVVFVEGDLLNSVVVVLCGALDLSLFRMTVRLVPGDSCGDYEYVSEVSRYRGTLVTCEHSELFVIDSQALAVLLERFPDEAKKLRESAEYRMCAWERASTVMAMSMNSLGKTNADFCNRNIPEEESHASALLQALDAKMEARFGRIELLQRELAGSLQQVQLRLAAGG